MSRSQFTFLSAVILISSTSAFADWTYNPGTGHWYNTTPKGLTWAQAEDWATKHGGHLVTINDAAENAWLAATYPFDSVLGDQYWIGFFQDTNDPSYSEPAGGWKWIGAPALCRWNVGNPTLCYVNWNTGSGEPNDGNPTKEENHATLHWGTGASGRWNDYLDVAVPAWSGIIEREVDPAVPTVSEWGLVVMTLLTLAAGTIILVRSRHARG